MGFGGFMGRLGLRVELFRESGAQVLLCSALLPCHPTNPEPLSA